MGICCLCSYNTVYIPLKEESYVRFLTEFCLYGIYQRQKSNVFLYCVEIT